MGWRAILGKDVCKAKGSTRDLEGDLLLAH